MEEWVDEGMNKVIWRQKSQQPTVFLSGGWEGKEGPKIRMLPSNGGISCLMAAETQMMENQEQRAQLEESGCVSKARPGRLERRYPNLCHDKSNSSITK